MTPVETILLVLAVIAFVSVGIGFWLAWRLAGTVDGLTAANLDLSARVAALEAARPTNEGW